MGLMDKLGDAVDAVGDTVEKAVGATERAVGEGVEESTELVSEGLDKVGLHDAASAVEHFGESVGDRLGATPEEKNLGETDDPRELIHGDPDAIGQAADHLGKFSSGFDEAGSALQRIDTGEWKGTAANAFHAAYTPHAKEWTTAAEASDGAQKALAEYKRVLTWAQGQAADAIAQYNDALAASKRAADDYNSQVDEYNAAAAAYNASGGKGARPTPPGAFVDPGVEMAKQAQTTLSSARQQRNTAASEASEAIKSATQNAPQEPKFHDRLAADLGDLAKIGYDANDHLIAGIVEGTGGLAQTVRLLNPMDPYNLTHPAAMLSTYASVGAGLVHDATHPVDAVKSMVGSGWGSDPAEAVGKLVPQVALGLATDGVGGAAADAATRAASSTVERAVVRDVAEDAGEAVGREASASAAPSAPLASGDVGAPTPRVPDAGVKPTGEPSTSPSTSRTPSTNESSSTVGKAPESESASPGEGSPKTPAGTETPPPEHTPDPGTAPAQTSGHQPDVSTPDRGGDSPQPASASDAGQAPVADRAPSPPSEPQVPQTSGTAEPPVTGAGPHTGGPPAPMVEPLAPPTSSLNIPPDHFPVAELPSVPGGHVPSPDELPTSQMPDTGAHTESAPVHGPEPGPHGDLQPHDGPHDPGAPGDGSGHPEHDGGHHDDGHPNDGHHDEGNHDDGHDHGDEQPFDPGDDGLTQDDHDAIADYTGPDGYRDMNAQLRDGDPTPSIQERADRLSSAIAKLPPYEGTVYRGAELPEDAILRYQPGSIVSEHAFTSTSMDPAGAFHGNVYFEIGSESGRVIGNLSRFPGESEVLFDRDTDFFVESVTRDESTGKTIIQLFERP